MATDAPMRRLGQPALLLLALFLFHAAGTATLPLLDRDEPRFAEASREMRERGELFVPTFNGAPRLDKPPLIYWLQMASYAVLGESDFAARLPSVIAAACLSLATLGFAARLYGTTAGWWSALMAGTAVQTIVHAKAAVADMAMVLFFLLAVWAGWELLRAAPARRWGWWGAFYAALAVAFLAKGPVGFLPLVAVWVFAWRRRPQGLAAAFAFPVGLLLMLGIIAAWGVPALLATDGAFLSVGIGRHVIGRALGVMEGHGASGLGTYAATLPFYFGTVFLSFFPWAIFLPWLVGRLRRRALLPAEIYLVIVIVLVFGIFTLVRTKLPHYTLPALPLLSILLGGEWLAAGRTVATLRRWTAGLLAAGLALSLGVFPLLAPHFPVPVLLRASSALLRPDMEFASAGFHEPSLVWYFRGAVEGWHQRLEPGEVSEFLRRPGPRFCVVSDGVLAGLAIEPEWNVFTAAGINPAKGERVALAMVVKTR